MSMQHLRSEEMAINRATDIIKKSERFSDLTAKIWKIAYNMTDAVNLENCCKGWDTFQKKIRTTYEEYSDLFPTINDEVWKKQEYLFSGEIEASEYITFLYEIVMNLNSKKNTGTTKNIFSEEKLCDLQIVCTVAYCKMFSKNLENRTKKHLVQNPNASIFELVDYKGKNWKILESYQKEFMDILAIEESYSQKEPAAYLALIGTKQEQIERIGIYENQLEKYRGKMVDGKWSIKTLDDWKNFKVFVEEKKAGYSWVLEKTKDDRKESFSGFLEYINLLEICILLVETKYNGDIKEENLSQIKNAIEIVCVAQHIDSLKKLINQMSEKGIQNTAIKNILEEVLQKESQIYEDFEKAKAFLEGEATPKR